MAAEMPGLVTRGDEVCSGRAGDGDGDDDVVDFFVDCSSAGFGGGGGGGPPSLGDFNCC